MNRFLLCVVAGLLVSAGNVSAQSGSGLGACSGSSEVGCLIPNLFGGTRGIVLPRGTPGEHEAHFVDGTQLSENFVPLNSAIGTQLALLPIASPASGFVYSFDKGAGVHTRTAQSFGSILSERGETIGKKKVFLGFTYQRFRFDKMDGQDLDAVPGVLTHIQGPGSGRATQDVIATTNDFDLKINQFAVYATVGVTNRFDISIAAPMMSVRFNATANATINRIASGADDCPGGTGTPCHFFDINNRPGSVEKTPPFSLGTNSSGIGDVTLRFKHSVYRGENAAVSVLTDVRLPTGNEREFLGSGAVGIRPFLAVSTKTGRISPHFNVGYQWNGKSQLAGNLLTRQEASLPDMFFYTAGTDIGVNSKLTIVGDLLGQRLLDAPRLSIGSFTAAGNRQFPRAFREIASFGMGSGSIGFKYNVAGQLLITANVLVRLDKSGLHQTATPLVGISYTF